MGFQCVPVGCLVDTAFGNTFHAGVAWRSSDDTTQIRAAPCHGHKCNWEQVEWKGKDCAACVFYSTEYLLVAAIVSLALCISQIDVCFSVTTPFFPKPGPGVVSAPQFCRAWIACRARFGVSAVRDYSALQFSIRRGLERVRARPRWHCTGTSRN